jgi:hemerythrin-like metal-binding protein
MIGPGLINWSEKFVTGITEIDEQHRMLVNCINVVNARLSQDFSAEFLDKITGDLEKYVLFHLETEEELMHRFKYSESNAEDTKAHLNKHQEFCTTVRSVREGIKAGHLISREELLTFLNGWLINHILKTDKNLAAFILQKRNPDLS